MLKIIIEHECDDMKLKENAYIFYAKYRWLMIIEDYGDHCEISYCPFCGKKLHILEGENDSGVDE